MAYERSKKKKLCIRRNLKRTLERIQRLKRKPFTTTPVRNWMRCTSQILRSMKGYGLRLSWRPLTILRTMENQIKLEPQCVVYPAI
jgi:hypothetical protein